MEEPKLPCGRHRNHLCARCEDIAEKLPPAESEQFWNKHRNALTAAGLVFAPVAIIATGGVGLGLYGFTTSGVAALSQAAMWQSAIGNVVAGSSFSILQSLGTWASMSVATGAGVVATGGVAAVAVGAGVQAAQGKYENDSKQPVQEAAAAAAATSSTSSGSCKCANCGEELP